MLVVRVELWPGGDSRVLRQIAATTIVNVGRTRGAKHHYEVRSLGLLAEVRHLQSDGALKLVERSIAALERAAVADPLAGWPGALDELADLAVPSPAPRLGALEESLQRWAAAAAQAEPLPARSAP